MSTQSVHIEKKDWELADTSARLLDALRAHHDAGAWVGVREAVRVSGVPEHLCEPALAFLGTARGADVRLNEHDEVEYLFESFAPMPGLLSLPGWLRPWAHRLRSGAAALGRFGAAVALSLVTATIALVYLGLVHELSFPGQPVVQNVLLGVVVLLALPALSLVFLVGAALLVLIQYMDSGFLLGLCVWAPILFVGYWITVFSLRITQGVNRWLFDRLGGLFSFGRERIDDLSDERNFTALVAGCGGQICVADLVRLYGWDLARTHEELTRLLVDYGGDIVVTDDAQILYVFEGLDAGADPVGTPPPVWEREKAPQEVFRQEGGLVADAIALGAFFFGALGLWGALVLTADELAGPASEQDVVAFVMAAGPWWQAVIAGCAAVLAAVPVYVFARHFVVWRRQRRFGERRRFLELVELACSHPEGAFVDAERFRSEHLAALDARIDVERTEGAKIWVSFPALVTRTS
ncbi:hypothetical protein FIV42_16050 [Persicimonas caeni]|uniref:Uncharacterized protein n=1 Tax=Persicimonas caeni TaxID=2292766 RepID=A0A4Y6PV66_PERCE|nr:hypothetical protein [Persicimonas caeni]QDG52198.1 hypothetical protein FIV42_16050 [Persicimonas caeni]QED33420.1 hypothetical protein FRD00_16045 [Persicimonas caeni]